MAKTTVPRQFQDARTEVGKRIKRTDDTQVVERDGHAIAGGKSIALCMMMVGCVKAVFWTGSAAPSRTTEINKRHTAAQPHSHRPSVSNDRLQLSYFRLGVRGLFIQQADFRISTKAREPLELKRSTRDKIMIK
jgi:hypothetical protein